MRRSDARGDRRASHLSEERHLHAGPTSCSHRTAAPQNAGHVWPPALTPRRHASKVAQWRAGCHEWSRHATEIRAAGCDMVQLSSPRTRVVQNTHPADCGRRGLLERYRAGSGVAAGLLEGQSSGARRGTIHTQPMRPAMLTTAAVTKAAAK